MSDPTLPPNFKNTVEDTAELVNALIDRVAGVAGDAAKRWLDGFDGKDVEAVATNAGTALKDQAMEAWAVAARNVIPPKDPKDGEH